MRLKEGEKGFINYRNYDDEELVRLACQGDLLAEEYLINKYKKLVKIKARSYFLIGADTEDIIQEGMIGLYKAVRNYQFKKLSSFKAFAELCITRQIITAIKSATRQKHIPLNSYISLNRPIYNDDSDRTLLDIVNNLIINDPQDLFLNSEKLNNLKARIKKILSDLERDVLESYLDAKSYQEIAVDLGRHVKSIDNALQRIKRKLELITK
ncbi:MAG: RNA polymerase sporulation sigma factor SigH [Candidatus Caldatribacteriota bacterium]|nr:RNA polymerase sporulation sigma factor SigH [Candidatus Caldatribacteriota bacterium]